MKRLAIIFMSILLAAASACSFTDAGLPFEDGSSATETSEQPVVEDSKSYSIALLTSENGINDSECMNAWQGVVTYGDSTSTSYKYYQPDDSSDNSAMLAVESAVQHGAEIVVLPSDSFKYLAYDLQYQYPNVSFLLVGAMPTSRSDGKIEAEKNVHCILFKEEQAGYLAGYSAVIEGKKTIGFIGDGDNEQNIRYAYGLVQGADDAMQKLRSHDVSVKYTFTKAAEKETSTALKKLRDLNAEVIFTANEEITDICAGLLKDEKIIYVGENNEKCSTKQYTSVLYNANRAIELSVSSFYSNGGKWLDAAAGAAMRFGIENGCIDLNTSEDAWFFETFNREIYDSTVEGFINDEIDLSSDTETPPPIATISYSYVE
ncbi:MAG: BMP family ABC transporter substrate-binding protein [Lachnospiraceae bacterium]|nr:BMP family ABC transporter substrate-binding protein [Lachnospiraceae bacterium]